MPEHKQMPSETEQIEYYTGLKNQLRRTVYFRTRIRPPHDIYTKRVMLTRDGLLTIRKYFGWDGCSGPTIDTKANARACLIHDAFYFLMEIGRLPQSYRKKVDAELRRYMLKDGAMGCRAKYYEAAVRAFGARAAAKKHKRKTKVAP